MPSPLTEYSPEWETFDGDASEWSGPNEHEILDEASQLELASELLAVGDEDELDQFLGDLVRKVARSVGSIVRSPLGKAIGNSLKDVIKTALPLAGGALGTLAGGPLGASIGSGLASMAGRAFGLELEGLSHEDRELAAANRFVRFASEAVTEAISAPPSHDPAASRRPRSLRLRDGARRDCCASLLRRTRAPARIGFILNGHAVIATGPQPAFTSDTRRTACTTSIAFSSKPIPKWRWRTTKPGSSSGWAKPAAIFGEAEEMEFASQLMEVSNEQELDQFLGDLIRRAGRALGGLVRSPDGQAIGGILKGAARQIAAACRSRAWHFHWRAARSADRRRPGIRGGQRRLELEAESWSQEDREFEGARQFVRVAADTVRNTIAAGPQAEPRRQRRPQSPRRRRRWLPGCCIAASRARE